MIKITEKNTFNRTSKKTKIIARAAIRCAGIVLSVILVNVILFAMVLWPLSCKNTLSVPLLKVWGEGRDIKEAGVQLTAENGLITFIHYATATTFPTEAEASSELQFIKVRPISLIISSFKGPARSLEHSAFGFGFTFSKSNRQGNQVQISYSALGVSAPNWSFLATICIWTVWLFLRRKSRRPKPANGCSACGYDLTGNISGVCPECGQPTNIKPSPKIWRPGWPIALMIMAIYLAAAFCAVEMINYFLGESGYRSVNFTSTHDRSFHFWSASAMLFIFAGAAHASRYLRKPEVFLVFGCLGAALLFPSYITGRSIPSDQRLDLSITWEVIVCAAFVAGMAIASKLVAEFAQRLRSFFNIATSQSS